MKNNNPSQTLTFFKRFVNFVLTIFYTSYEFGIPVRSRSSRQNSSQTSATAK